LLAKLELEKVTAEATTASANVAAFITSAVKEANPVRTANEAHVFGCPGYSQIVLDSRSAISG